MSSQRRGRLRTPQPSSATAARRRLSLLVFLRLGGSLRTYKREGKGLHLKSGLFPLTRLPTPNRPPRTENVLFFFAKKNRQARTCRAAQPSLTECGATHNRCCKVCGNIAGVRTLQKRGIVTRCLQAEREAATGQACKSHMLVVGRADVSSSLACMHSRPQSSPLSDVFAAPCCWRTRSLAPLRRNVKQDFIFFLFALNGVGVLFSVRGACETGLASSMLEGFVH